LLPTVFNAPVRHALVRFASLESRQGTVAEKTGAALFPVLREDVIPVLADQIQQSRSASSVPRRGCRQVDVCCRLIVVAQAARVGPTICCAHGPVAGVGACVLRQRRWSNGRPCIKHVSSRLTAWPVRVVGAITAQGAPAWRFFQRHPKGLAEWPRQRRTVLQTTVWAIPKGRFDQIGIGDAPLDGSSRIIAFGGKRVCDGFLDTGLSC